MARRLPPLLALRAFEAAARFESFSAAGDELSVTHGAISRQVALLETWLGVQVFQRMGKRVQLTDAGRRYLVAVRTAFDSIDAATTQLRENGTVRRLRIEALPTFAMRWLLPRLSQFQRLYPGVELKLSTSERPLDAGTDGFDVAIRRGPGHWPNCQCQEFLEEAEIPVCSPALLRRTPLAVPADLARHTLLHSDTRPQAWSKWLAAAGVSASACQKRQSFNHFYLTLQAAIDGLGVTLGPLPLIDDELASGRLVIPLPKPVLRARSYWWIVPRQRADEALIADFCAWLERASALPAVAAD